MKKIQEKFHIYLDADNIIRATEQTKVTKESSKGFADTVTRIVKEAEDKPSKLVVNLGSMEGVPPLQGRKDLSRMIKDNGIEKVAFFGMSAMSKVVAKFIVNAAGIKNVQFFNSEKEVLD